MTRLFVSLDLLRRALALEAYPLATKDLIAAVTNSDTLVTADTAKLALDTATDKEAHAALNADLTANGPVGVLVQAADGSQTVVVYRASGSDVAADPPIRIAG